jgi:hypothetical protein
MRDEPSALPPEIFTLAEIFARIAERGRKLREAQKQTAGCAKVSEASTPPADQMPVNEKQGT